MLPFAFYVMETSAPIPRGSRFALLRRITNLREGGAKGLDPQKQRVAIVTLASPKVHGEPLHGNRYGHGPSIREDPFPGQLALYGRLADQ